MTARLTTTAVCTPRRRRRGRGPLPDYLRRGGPSTITLAMPANSSGESGCDSMTRTSHAVAKTESSFSSRSPTTLMILQSILSTGKDLCTAVTQRLDSACRFVMTMSTEGGPRHVLSLEGRTSPAVRPSYLSPTAGLRALVSHMDGRNSSGRSGIRGPTGAEPEVESDVMVCKQARIPRL